MKHIFITTLTYILFLFSTEISFAQSTQIRGFVDGLATYEDGKVSFG